MSSSMNTPEYISGVSVTVDDLIRIRANIKGLSLDRIKRTQHKSTGSRYSIIRGRGMEYEESRVYVAGDDVRSMDWRVMARTSEPHTKIFTEEKERSVVLLVDLSNSMFFGTKFAFKSWCASQIAAHIGWITINSGDRLGGIMANSFNHYEIRPTNKRAALMRMFAHLAELNERYDVNYHAGENRLNVMLKELKRVIKPGSIVVLISDFMGLTNESSALISSFNKHNELLAFWVHDKSETSQWPVGQYQISFGEHSKMLDFGNNSNKKWLDEHQQRHKFNVDSLAKQFQLLLFPISCNVPVTVQLRHYLTKAIH